MLIIFSPITGAICLFSYVRHFTGFVFSTLVEVHLPLACSTATMPLPVQLASLALKLLLCLSYPTLITFTQASILGKDCSRRCLQNDVTGEGQCTG